MSRLCIDVFAPPFPGHLHPILGVARVLREFADVRVLSTPDAASRVAASGLDFQPILGAHVADIWEISNTNGPVRGRPWMLWSQFRKNMRLMPALRADVWAAWEQRKPDLALVDFTLPAIGHWARAGGIRWWTSHPSPLAIETPDGTPSYIGGLMPPRGSIGRLRDAFGRAGTRLFKRSVFALLKGQMVQLGIPGAYRTDGSEQAYSDEVLLALGLRELEFPSTWPKAARFTGPIFYTPPIMGDAVPSVCAMDAHRKNILVTIGTHLPYARRQTLELVKTWARAMPEVFFHYTAGGDTTAEIVSGENWRVYPYLNYEDGLERFDAIVHHGGAGITYYAMRAARPVVVLPQDYDQFDFAARLEYRQLARWCRKAARLPEVLRQALQDETMHQAQLRFAGLLRASDTRSQIVRILREQGLITGDQSDAD